MVLVPPWLKCWPLPAPPAHCSSVSVAVQPVGSVACECYLDLQPSGLCAELTPLKTSSVLFSYTCGDRPGVSPLPLYSFLLPPVPPEPPTPTSSATLSAVSHILPSPSPTPSLLLGLTVLGLHPTDPSCLATCAQCLKMAATLRTCQDKAVPCPYFRGRKHTCWSDQSLSVPWGPKVPGLAVTGEDLGCMAEGME